MKRTAEEEMARLLSDKYLVPLHQRHVRFIGERQVELGETWLEAHEELQMRWIRDCGSNLYDERGTDGAGFTTRWHGIPVRRHHHPRGEALQLVNKCDGATVVVPMIDMEVWSLLMDGFGSSDRFKEKP